MKGTGKTIDLEIKGKQNILATMIIEVVGKPPEHLKEVLEDISNKINQEKGTKVQNKKIHESKPLEKHKEFFSTFMEVEIITDHILDLTRIILTYMPSHIEIISPESISISNNYLNEILNETTRKMHKYDEAARALKSHTIMLEKHIKENIPKKEDNSKEKEK